MFNIKLIYRIIIVIAFFVYAFSACEYQTDEVFFREVDENVPLPDLEIDLNLCTDTIYVYQNTTVKLTLSLTNKDLYDVKFYINNIEVENVQKTDGNNYSFYLDISMHSIAEVKAEIYTSTETGSIGDIVGYEAFIYKSDKWTLIRCNDVLAYEKTIENGRLKISWTPIKSKLNSKYCIISSNVTDSTYNTWYIDSNYIAGNNYISITYGNDDISGYGIYDYIYNYESPDVYINNTDSFVIHWNKFKYYNNIKGYKIAIGDETFFLNSNDTLLTYKNGVLGNSYYVEFYLVPFDDNPNHSDEMLMGTNSAYYPSALLEYFTNIEYTYFPLTGNSFYYWSRENNNLFFYKYDLSSKTVTHSEDFSTPYVVVSSNDMYVLEEDNDYLRLYNNTLTPIKSILKTNISSNLFNMYPSISNNGFIVFNDYSKRSLVVYDILTESFITEVPVSTYYSTRYKISSNGDYIYDHRFNTLYKIEDDSYSVVYVDTQEYSYYEFLPNTDQIALYNGNTFYLKNCTDYSTDRSFSLDNTTIANIDYTNQKILTYNENDELIIYSLNDGSILNVIPANYSQSSYIFNNYIIQDHYQFNLNYL